MQKLIPLTLENGGESKTNKQKAEELYGGLNDKLWDVLQIQEDKDPYYGAEYLWQLIGEYAPNAQQYLIQGKSDEYKNVPPMTPRLQEMKDKLSKMTPQQISDILGKDYSKANLFNIGSYLPEGIGVIDALKYKNEYERLKKAGYSFADGGLIKLQLVPETEEKAEILLRLEI